MERQGPCFSVAEIKSRSFAVDSVLSKSKNQQLTGSVGNDEISLDQNDFPSVT